LLVPVSAVLAAEEGATETDGELSEVTVRASRVANTQPAGSYASLATALRFDPQTELQSRGLPEGQADVAVRGGIFENTGFVVGAITVMDPQTGHYTAGLPIDPGFLSIPGLLTGIDNALTGFNSNIASVAYSLPVVRSGGDVVLGIGENNLIFTSLRLAKVTNLKSGNQLSFGLSAALSEGDGTLPNGDHDFERYNLHIQHRQGNAQTDVLLSYQDKFYAWPGAYTGFASLAETDHTKTQLILANHRREIENGWFEVSAYYRELDDDYDFDRTTQESGVPGSFEHLTRAYAVGLQGSYRSGLVDWRYGGQLTGDKLVRSTDLTEGDFTSRNYAKFSLIPSIDIAHSGDNIVTARIGATLDTSNRDSSAVSPVAGLTVQTTSSSGSNFYTLEYASASQLPGYTALNSRPAGLFGGNADLGREKARQLSLSFIRESSNWTGSATLFYRKDSDLVDWTFFTGRPFSRQANPVDLDVLGLEIFATRQWYSLELVAGYTYLDKDPDYVSAEVDASFYALNFARHRATLALRYQLTSQLEVRLDNEYRVQEDNSLRTSRDTAFLASLALAWESESIRGLGLALTADNVTDSDYQFFPGTPAVGRQVSVSASYRW
jgi:hypothetical protein